MAITRGAPITFFRLPDKKCTSSPQARSNLSIQRHQPRNRRHLHHTKNPSSNGSLVLQRSCRFRVPQKVRLGVGDDSSADTPQAELGDPDHRLFRDIDYQFHSPSQCTLLRFLRALDLSLPISSTNIVRSSDCASYSTPSVIKQNQNQTRFLDDRICFANPNLFPTPWKADGDKS
ncbi:hypothetical protein BD779DRAFT_200583 [Infundibulicybe gibba]|nr:hypothetical protein BD779DRAFT_200583 [Infundibulicybe gibba]